MILPHHSLLLAQRAITGNVTQAQVSVALNQPQYAQRLDPQLPALSIEMDRWFDWSGPKVGQPNPFVNSVFQQIKERTGQPMFLRVGANSEDRATIDSSFEVVNLTFPAPTPDTPAPEASSIQIGRDWYKLSNNLPEGTDFQWGVNYKIHNETETRAQIRQVAAAFQDSGVRVNLRNLEIGNEVDLGDRGSTRPPETPQGYVDYWTQIVKAVLGRGEIALGKTGGTFLSPGGFARSIRFNTNWVWTAMSAFSAGLNQDQQISAVTNQFTGHLYSASYNAAFDVTPGVLMNKVYVRGNLSTRVGDAIVTRSQGLKYVLGESNSYSNHGAPGASNAAEAVMWGTDYMLYAASSGIERVHFHNGRGFAYSVLQPSILNGSGLDDGLGHPDRPHIAPLWNAFLIVAEAIGTSGNAYVAELGINSSTTAAYGIYENHSLRRVVLINSQVYVPTTRGGRPGEDITLTNWSGKYATVKRFEAPFTNSTSGLTWAGQNYDTASNQPSGQLVEVPLNGSSISIEASSIALICIK